MKYSYTLLTAAALVLASPMPADNNRGNQHAGACSPAYPGTFGIVVETLGAQKQARHDDFTRLPPRQVLSQIPDGQVQAPTVTTRPPAPSTPAPSTKHTSQPPASPCSSPASSMSQQSTTPCSSPTSSTSKHSTTPCSSPASSTSKQSTTPCSSPATSSTKHTTSHSTTTECATPSTTKHSSSTSPCGPPSSSMPMKPPVTQIGDGQIQNPATTPITKHSGTASMPMKPPVTQIGDGQIQNPGPSQPPATTKRTTTTTTTSTITAATCSGSSSGCKPAEPTSEPAKPKMSGTPVTVIPDGQPQVPTGKPQTWNHIGACATDSTLKLTLSDGVLKDARGWTGYIAANRQFQFDNPPQDGAAIVSGFSVCSNGSLALKGNNIFWECLSGNFYNLYDTNIAAQCRPVALQVAQLVEC